MALAERLVQEGRQVIVTGRRKENLDQFVKNHGAESADAEVLDIEQLGRAPEVVAKLTARHPDIDCVVLNAGMQRRSGKICWRG